MLVGVVDGWLAACRVRVEMNLSPNMGTHLLAQYQQSRWAVLLLKLCLQARSAGPSGAGLNKAKLRCCSGRLSHLVPATQRSTPEGTH